MIRRFCIITLLLLIVSGYALAQTPVLNVADLQSQIQQLLDQVKQLQEKITQIETELGTGPSGESTPTVSAPAVVAPVIERNLGPGSSGEDVRKLQEYLAQDPAIYPQKLITGYFGPLTREAVKRWQARHDIETVGFVGPISRAKLQEFAAVFGASVPASPVAAPTPVSANQIESVVTTVPLSVASTVASTLTPAPAPTVVTTTQPTSTTPSATSATITSSSPSTTTSAPTTTTTATTTATTTTATTTTASTTPSTTTITTATPSTTAISTPTGLVATNPAQRSIALSWSAGDSGVAGYNVYRTCISGTTCTSGAKIISSGSLLTSSGTVFTADVGLIQSATISYTVAAYDSAGNVSAQSSPVTATTLSGTVTVPQIQGVTATVSGNAVILSWQYTANAYSYAILRGTGTSASTATYGSIYFGEGKYLSYTDANLTSQTYYYKIKAYSDGGIISPESVPVSATIGTAAAPTDTTSPTATLSISGITQNKVYAGFNASEGVQAWFEYGLTTNYDSTYGFTQASWNFDFRTSDGRYLEGLSAGTTYHIRVKVIDAAGNVGYSPDYTFTTLAASNIPILNGGPTITFYPSSEAAPDYYHFYFNTDIKCQDGIYWDTSTNYGSSKIGTSDPTYQSTTHTFGLFMPVPGVTYSAPYATDLLPDTAYYYKFTCAISAGTLEKTGTFTTGSYTGQSSSESTITTTATTTMSTSPLGLASLLETLASLLEKLVNR